MNLNKRILIQFGEKVKELRKSKGWSQEQLSFHANLHRTYIGMIERAEKNITLLNIEKIAKALDIEIKELFDEITLF
ncbi:helix-turn-helix domain-containing protein [Pedobacter sp. SL55]|uniref:helix-turn-helix domain-containing protein n=1 Tax=Pedobacter sp. SL55 TaxID=2995161 RepID=UPI00226F3CA8|nr:helix-turn-helix transcriptional regulator [Pedobacter sp. SL55]WAC42342.1 helix-turn-helix transcriptional regulator [Pedobacter sp. SL55]